jgi:hypothetical protein
VAGNSTAFHRLRRQIDRVRSLGELPEAIAAEAATELDRQLRQQIAAGQGPDGKPWQPTADGRTPLRNAGDGLTVRAVGSVVLARLTGSAVRHHLGTARGRIKRQVLPSARMPQRMTATLRTIASRRFQRAMASDG